jgi:hypothetical protein
MFKMNYRIHNECINNLQFNIEEEVIPIESNIIIYDYVFREFKENFNEEYLWCKYFNKVIEKHIDNGNWSIVIIYDKNIELFFKNNNPYLLINLANQPILLISLEVKNTSYLEGL